jgi:hypothetical protein
LCVCVCVCVVLVCVCLRVSVSVPPRPPSPLSPTVSQGEMYIAGYGPEWLEKHGFDCPEQEGEPLPENNENDAELSEEILIDADVDKNEAVAGLLGLGGVVEEVGVGAAVVDDPESAPEPVPVVKPKPPRKLRKPEQVWNMQALFAELAAEHRFSVLAGKSNFIAWFVNQPLPTQECLLGSCMREVFLAVVCFLGQRQHTEHASTFQSLATTLGKAETCKGWWKGENDPAHDMRAQWGLISPGAGAAALTPLELLTIFSTITSEVETAQKGPAALLLDRSLACVNQLIFLTSNFISHTPARTPGHTPCVTTGASKLMPLSPGLCGAKQSILDCVLEGVHAGAGAAMKELFLSLVEGEGADRKCRNFVHTSWATQIAPTLKHKLMNHSKQANPVTVGLCGLITIALEGKVGQAVVFVFGFVVHGGGGGGGGHIVLQ